MGRAEPAAEESLTIRELRVIPPSRTVTINGEVLNLTPLEFDLLLCLVRSPDRVLSRDRLLDEISGRDYEVFDRSIDVHISSLRRKLGDDVVGLGDERDERRQRVAHRNERALLIVEHGGKRFLGRPAIGIAVAFESAFGIHGASNPLATIHTTQIPLFNRNMFNTRCIAAYITKF